MSDLPEGWAYAPLSYLTTKVGSGATPRGGESAYSDSGIPLIRSMNVVFFGFKRQGLAFIDERQASALNNAEVRAGDVLLNITGASIGRVTIAPSDMDGARVNQHVCIIRPVDDLDKRFLNAFLSSPIMQEAIGAENYGATRQALTKQQVLDFQIPIAPLNEQRRIADRLDALLARVDACRGRLDRIPALIKRFRQAVLAAATSGKLTEEWREARGITEEWAEATLGDIISRVEAGLNFQCIERPPVDGERGLVKISAVTWGTYDDDESKTFPPGKDVPESTRIRPGDFLISRANTLELVGACVIVESVRRAVYLSDKVLRLVMDDALKPWVLYVLRSPYGRAQIESLASGNQLSMRNLSQANLRTVKVPLPGDDERAEILRRVETLFAFANRWEARVNAARDAATRITPALLVKAFRGELVPQAPDDEPAAVLLERIRQAPAAPAPRARRSAKAGADAAPTAPGRKRTAAKQPAEPRDLFSPQTP